VSSTRIAIALCAALLCALGAPAARAATAYPPGVEHLSFAAGPYEITSGANLILVDTNHVPKPSVDGYIVSMAPNLHYSLPSGKCCGRVPRVDVIHLHHGVWLSNGAAGVGEGDSFGSLYPFFAAGEEKTAYTLPPGYGYPVGASDAWFLNYMIHNLTETPAKVYITYDIGFIPASSPLAAHITPVHPIWMDVQAHHLYPVFNVLRGSGANGRFTYPDMASDPYGGGPPLNEFTIDHPGTLVTTAGHIHPGGLYDDLDLIRAGATPGPGTIPGNAPGSVRLFRSSAHYFDKRGPISWDMAMQATAPDWRPEVRTGDVLRLSATYDTRRASWYESMGIMVVFEAYDDESGVDPFTHPLDETGDLTHGHLPENDNHGGATSLGVNPLKFPSCRTNTVNIGSFRYLPGDFRAAGSERCAPTVTEGQSLTFVNDDASPFAARNLFSPNAAYLQSIFHTVTSCQDPCGLNTGISYPLANGAGNFDSAQLGVGLPASGQLEWMTPTDLKPGTYTFFCRIHPFMRGVFRVVG
jgi:hypothetical protein